MAKLNPPDPFDFTNPTGWSEWKRRFLRYRTASELSKKEEEVQIDTLIYTMGPEAEAIWNTFVFPPPADNRDMSKEFDSVMTKFDGHFIPKRNTIHERAKFNTRVQLSDESVEQFVRALYTLSEHCLFENRDDAIRDRLVIGLRDSHVSRELQEVGDELTLIKAVEKARNTELVRKHDAQMAMSPSSNSDVNAIRGRGRGWGRGRGRGRGQSKNDQTPAGPGRTDHAQGYQDKCPKCHREHPKFKCPAFHRKCGKCGEKGHYACACPNKSKKLNQIENHTGGAENQDQESYFLGGVSTDDNSSKAVNACVNDKWRITLRCNGSDVPFRIDTGADVSIISMKQYKKLNDHPKLCASNNVLSSPGGEVVYSGQFIARIEHDGTKYHHRVFVVNDIAENLLSGSVADRLGLIKRVCQVSEYGLVKCKPVDIKLKTDAQPYSIATARRVPIHLVPKVEEELKRLEANGIIEPVTEPTEWCAGMVPVVKNNGQVRTCVDLKKLNENILRERYIIPTIEEILPKLAGSRFFTTLDAHSGFYQIPLSPESRRLTCFITSLGRFQFCRLPFGITSATEIFQREMAKILQGLKGVEIYVDDILIHGATEAEHDSRLNEVLKVLKSAGLKLNESKCKYKQTSIDYFGHTISGNGVRPTKEKVKALVEMQPPSDVGQLRVIMGMINYLGRFIPNLSQVAQPMNELLKSDRVWSWDCAQSDAFKKIKELLTEAPALAFYDVNRETIVSADASSYGIGGVLLQRYSDGLKPVAFFSKTLTQSQRNYAQIEKECLALVTTCERFAMYLVGLESFKLITDHQPLVPLINKRDIGDSPLRCQRLLMRLMRFNCKAEHQPGKNLVISDALSRHPMKNTGKSVLEDEVEVHVGSVKENWPVSDTMMDKIREASSSDEMLKLTSFYTLNGWPRYYDDLPQGMNDYYSERGMLSVMNGVLTHGDRIVIPQSLRQDVLVRIHEGHQGIVKCRERARSSVWWPGITKDIKQLVSGCAICQENKPTQRREPLMPAPLPTGPWERVGADLLDYKGQKYMVMIDCYSRFLELVHLPVTTCAFVVNKMKSVFARHGLPQVLITDNGPQFSAREFKEFMEFCGTQHVTSSPHFPQSNGEAERAVQVAKKILAQKDPALALLNLRTTPHSATGYSPAQLLMGRQLRNRVPTLPKNLTPKWPKNGEVKRNDEIAKSSYKYYYDRRHGVRPLSTLAPGDLVREKTDSAKGWSSPKTVVMEHNTPRSYIVQGDHGQPQRRNRCQLQKIPDTGVPDMQLQPSTSPSIPAEECGDPPQVSPPQVESNQDSSVSNDTPKVRIRYGRCVKPPKKLNL
jgi:hypothetical protein